MSRDSRTGSIVQNTPLGIGPREKETAAVKVMESTRTMEQYANALHRKARETNFPFQRCEAPSVVKIGFAIAHKAWRPVF